jgi:HAD superfamily hydrolase (TIGR01509 family)
VSRCPFELVILDCDGVLVDSEPIANRIFSEMLRALGLEMSFEETVREFMGRSMASCVEKIEARTGRPVPGMFLDDFRKRTYEAFESELRPVDGVVEALDRIDLPVCVASSGSHDKMRTTLGLTGLLPRLEGRLFSAGDVPRGKPHPDLFLHAARRSGVEPGGCAVVEDTVVGVTAATSAGMAAFGYCGLSDPDELARAGAQVFRDMRELPGLVGS